MTSRYAAKDQVAIVGVGTTTYSREIPGATHGSLALEASKRAILDAGLTASDIDGLSGSHVAPQFIQLGLGLPKVTFFTCGIPPIVNQFLPALNAVFSGTCDVALVYHSVYRNVSQSHTAAKDGIRARAAMGGMDYRNFYGTGQVTEEPLGMFGSVPYASWARRYFHEYGGSREDLGRVAINNRTNALTNPHAVMREPLNMEQYMSARMIREPLCLYDMDIPIDGADAFVLTTAERARDMDCQPVLVHAATMGQTHEPGEENTVDLSYTGHRVVVEKLRNQSDINLTDVDLFFPYDGFSIMTLSWFEEVGYCGRGEAGPFLKSCWDEENQRFMINGKMPINPHGGSLSEGGTQGAGHLREAVMQLRGQAEDRQVPGVKTALVTPGGYFYNAQGMLLRTE